MVKDWFKTAEINKLIDDLWKKYQNGLVANVSKGEVPDGGAGLARYLAKYVASPPIAVRRIISYDGSNVTYWYNDHKTKAGGLRQVARFLSDVWSTHKPKVFNGSLLWLQQQRNLKNGCL